MSWYQNNIYSQWVNFPFGDQRIRDDSGNRAAASTESRERKPHIHVERLVGDVRPVRPWSPATPALWGRQEESQAEDGSANRRRQVASEYGAAAPDADTGYYTTSTTYPAPDRQKPQRIPAQFQVIKARLEVGQQRCLDLTVAASHLNGKWVPPAWRDMPAEWRGVPHLKICKQYRRENCGGQEVYNPCFDKQVRYFSGSKADEYRVTIDKERNRLVGRRGPLDTTKASIVDVRRLANPKVVRSGWGTLVVMLNGEIRVANHAEEQNIHHSSLSAGQDVLFAGEIKTDETGKVLAVAPRSGHFKPEARHFDAFCRYLQNQGITGFAIEQEFGEMRQAPAGANQGPSPGKLRRRATIRIGSRPANGSAS